MKTTLVTLCMALSLSACSLFKTDLTYQDSRGTVVLHQAACTSQVIMEGVPENLKDKMKAAEVIIGKEATVKACWVDGKELGAEAASGYFVVAENGGYALFPKDSFK